MSHIHRLIIYNYRGIKHLDCDFGDENLIILIGRGDSGKLPFSMLFMQFYLLLGI